MALGTRNLLVVCRNCGLIVDRKRKSDDWRSTPELLLSVRCGNCYSLARDGDVMFSFDGGETFIHKKGRQKWRHRPKARSTPRPSPFWQPPDPPSHEIAAPFRMTVGPLVLHERAHAVVLVTAAAVVSVCFLILLSPILRVIVREFGDMVDRATMPVAFVSSENLELRQVAMNEGYCEGLRRELDSTRAGSSVEARSYRKRYYEECGAKP